jgi:MFS transporter, UMF1 family
MKLNKNLIGWMIYDFANSSFTTIIVTVIYSAYFMKVVVPNNEALGTALWGRAISISMTLVALSAPIFGAVADFSRAKKRFLFFNCYLTVIFTALLFFVQRGDIFIGMLFFIIANFGFNSANVFYDAFLPEISSHEDMGKVSGMGWSLGYVGGLLSLVIALVVVKWNVRYVFPAIALFFGFFAIFTFLWLKEIKLPSKRSNYFRIAVQRIKFTFTHVFHFKELGKFLIAYLIYNDGIITVIVFAAIYGVNQFAMTQQEIIKYFIYAQFTSILGSYVFGHITDKIGAKRALTLSLFIWTGVVIWAFFCATKLEYYYVGMTAGLAIGSSQANSRTLLALLTPKDKQAEFFGFYAVTGRLSSIFGPLVYGEIALRTGSQRYSILSLIAFFFVGGVLLQFVNEKKGKQAALEYREEEDS